MDNVISIRRQHGFSLVELMVSVVIGLLAIMFATRMIVNIERNKQSALGGSDSMQNGMLAMFSMNADAAASGWGLNDAAALGCDTAFNDTQGYALAPATRGTATIHPMSPVVIESNGSAPDRITFYAGSHMSGSGSLRVVSNYSSGTSIQVDRIPYGFSTGDVILVAPDTADTTQCALAQISTIQTASGSQPSLSFASGGSNRFNSGALGPSFKANAARAFNLGQASNLSFHTWSVSGGLLQLRATDLDGSSQTPTTVADNIVSIKAEYGFDLSPGQLATGSTLQVGKWSTTMINADGVGTGGEAEDYRHIAAVRIAVVARSKNPEQPPPGGSCTATTTQPTVFASAVPSTVTAVPITVDVAVAGDPVKWQCYRYRVFETIVPLRNLAWRP